MIHTARGLPAMSDSSVPSALPRHEIAEAPYVIMQQKAQEAPLKTEPPV